MTKSKKGKDEKKGRKIFTKKQPISFFPWMAEGKKFYV